MGLLQTRYWPQHGHRLRLGNDIQADCLDTLMFQMKLSRCLIGEVDDSALYDRPAIVDADDHRSAVSQIGDLHHGPERQSRMCCGQIVHIERLSAGSLFAIEVASVPGRGPNLIGPCPLDLCRLSGWFRPVLSYRANSIVVRARVALSRSQAGDAQKHRQSMSYAFSHSVHLAYKGFGPYVGRSFLAKG